MSETVVFKTKEEKQLAYIPEKCIGCGSCVMVCPKSALVIGSVGAVARGLIDKDFLEGVPDLCILCGICAKACPAGALELKQAGKALNDKSYLRVAMKETTVDDKCVHCGLCEQVCPQACIEVTQWLADDGSARIDGETKIDNDTCVHCGWCMAVCPTHAITVEKPFAGTWHREESVCVACRTCVDTCPCNALFNPEWGSGVRVDKVAQRPDVCIYCGACDVSCPVHAITVKKTAIVPEVEKKAILDKKLLNADAPRPKLTSVLVTDRDACLGCGNCVIVCAVNASDADVGAGYLNEVDSKKVLEIRNGAVNVVSQELCGSCGACAMICPVDAIRLEVREV